MNTTIAIDALEPKLTALFAKIGEASQDSVGITRDAYGERETAAAEKLLSFARAAGLEANYDRVGNLHVTAAGRFDEKPEILIASHLDSVPHGGNYDGLAGVIGGIGVLMVLPPEIGAVRVIGFRGEESPWFGTAYLGSKLMLGELGRKDASVLRRFDTGMTLAEHLAALGFDQPRAKTPIIPLDRVKAYLELHIEQGPLLEDRKRPVGIATAIRGNIRYPFAKCIGRYAHSAAVPRDLRSDAVMATAKLVTHADECWRALIEAGHDDLVFTCGIFQTDAAEHAMTKVAGEVSFSINIGAVDDSVMEDMRNKIMTRADELTREHHVRFDFGKRVGTPAIALDSSVVACVEQASEEVGINPVLMPTVGHDATMFARRGIPTSVLLIRNSNGSHNPAEHMEMADFIAGTKVLAGAVRALCRSA